jgi:very-short-patch-repair endonuclease
VTATIDQETSSPWSLSGAALLEPWRKRARGEALPIQRTSPGETASERALWQALEAWDRGWVQEYATAKYRLDFFLPSHRLAVEVDGSSHHGLLKMQQDEARDAWHLERGIVTFRVSADEVLADLEGVLSLVVERMRFLEEAPAPADVLMLRPVLDEVAVADVESHGMDRANEELEAEIEGYTGVACLTVLPALESKGWARFLSRRG